jgi:hypothetical protein
MPMDSNAPTSSAFSRDMRNLRHANAVSWKSRALRCVLLLIIAILVMLNVVYLISAVSMGFPVSAALNIWVYAELSLAVLLAVAAFGVLAPAPFAIKAGAATSALSSLIFLGLSGVVVFNVLAGGSYGKLKLVDMWILVILPLVLSVLSVVLQVRTIKRIRIT